MQDGPYCEAPKCVQDACVVCPLCGEPSFCSEECRDQSRGLVYHLELGMCSGKITYTPRSVLDRMRSALGADPEARRILAEKQQPCPPQSGGVLVLDLLDMSNACAILNSSAQPPASVLAKLTQLESISTLDASLRERYISVLAEWGSERILVVVRTRRQGSLILQA